MAVSENVVYHPANGTNFDRENHTTICSLWISRHHIFRQAHTVPAMAPKPSPTASQLDELSLDMQHLFKIDGVAFAQ